jgi:hypothetical protein
MDSDRNIWNLVFIKVNYTAHNEPSAEQCGRFPEGDIHQAY